MIRDITIGLVFVVGLAASVHGQTVLYVDGDSPNDGPGNDWGHAYHYLQDALAVASAGTEVWVAEGTYRPDESTASPTGTGDREATFQLTGGVAVRGGYRGLDGGGDPNDRGFTSTLSGNIGTPGDNTDNSRHVVTGSSADATAVLDGFTITSGYADGTWPHDSGGGMFNDAGGPTVANCTFVGNEADLLGGGMYSYMGSPTVDNCTFIGNTAEVGGGICNDNADSAVRNSMFGGNSASHIGGGMISFGGTSTVDNCTFIGNEAGAGGGLDNDNTSATVANLPFIGNTSNGDGGGMYNGSSNLTVLNCAFIDNLARGGTYVYGGGMWNSYCNLTVTNCTFSGNYVLAGWLESDQPSAKGGGMYNSHSDLTMTNCAFSGNHALAEATDSGAAESYGGGLYNWENSPTVVNCTFVGNRATATSDGIYNVSYGGGVYTWDDELLLTNCILWGNAADTGPQMYNESSTPTVTYSCVQDGWPGEGNIFVDPMLSAGDLHLMPGSPCIDAGDNTAVPADTSPKTSVP